MLTTDMHYAFSTEFARCNSSTSVYGCRIKQKVPTQLDLYIYADLKKNKTIKIPGFKFCTPGVRFVYNRPIIDAKIKIA